MEAAGDSDVVDRPVRVTQQMHGSFDAPPSKPDIRPHADRLLKGPVEFRDAEAAFGSQLRRR